MGMTVMDHSTHHSGAAHDHTAHDHTAHDRTTRDRATHDHATHAGPTPDHATHDQATHDHAAHTAGHTHGATWGTAVKATLHCLTGCAIGEILGMVIGTALLWDNVPTMALAITLAFIFGYSFTLFAVVRAGVSLKAAIKVALAADTVSIAVMELVDNAIIALTPGAMDAHLSDGLFWSALLGGFAVAFVITTPVNKWMIGRGKGHAVVHAYH
jgi:ABC-type nickel/cobalt efflux system permease component RcnA